MNTIPYCPYAPGFKYGFDVPPEKWIPIQPERYVYHLTPGRRAEHSEYYDFKRLNIALKGLYGKDYFREGVWANNQMRSLWQLYPINIDSFGMNMKCILNWVRSIDVWRIDTLAFSAKWYVDPNHMLTDFNSKENWVFTESSVPPHALKLFHFNINEYKFLFKKTNMPEFRLEPNRETNRIIKYKRVQQKLAFN